MKFRIYIPPASPINSAMADKGKMMTKRKVQQHIISIATNILEKHKNKNTKKNLFHKKIFLEFAFKA